MVPVLLAVAFLSTPPPAWIQRANVAPTSEFVTWRLADVLGTPAVEGITIDRDLIDGTMNVSVVDSRFDPPRVVRRRSLKGHQLRWLQTGKRDGLHRNEIAVDLEDKAGKETAYLLRVGRGFRLELVRTVRGHNLAERTFSH